MSGLVFMRRAIALSQNFTRDPGCGPFGAVIVQDGVIIAEGVNQVTAAHDPTAHAEIVAIRAAAAALGRFSLAGCEIYASCEPCPMCLGAIYWARHDRLWYGNTRGDAASVGFDDAFLYDELPKPPAERRMGTVQLLPDEAIAAFQAWAASPDKVPY